MTELLYGIAIAPFKDMVGSPAFFAEVLIGGVFAGLMYSLVALGFVLIFKASGVFNFAQGVMVLFAALTLVGLLERGVPVVGALLGTTAVMVALAWVIERVVLRPLVNQVQFILSLVALKALPVLILGGFTSVPGAVVGGLIIGVGEKVGEVYWGPLVGGAIENWFAYVLALAFLLVRPQGLFGEKIIERV